MYLGNIMLLSRTHWALYQGINDIFSGSGQMSTQPYDVSSYNLTHDTVDFLLFQNKTTDI